MRIFSLTCAHARAQASAWIDGELADASEWNAHLARCKDCRAHLAELRGTMALLAPMRREELTTDLWPRIAEEALASRSRSRPRWTHHVARFAAAFVGFAGTAYLLRSTTAEHASGPAMPETTTVGWTAPLHAPQQDLRRLEASAERLLLASLEQTAEMPR